MQTLTFYYIIVFTFINRLFRFFEKPKNKPIEIGDSVEFKTMIDCYSTGRVYRIENNKAMVRGVFMHSEYTQWVDIKKLNIIEPII